MISTSARVNPAIPRRVSRFCDTPRRLSPPAHPDYDQQVTINVLLFASYADAFGASSVAVDLPNGATVAELVRELLARPGAAALPARPLVAVNQAYAALSQRLAAGDEVAVIPPVAGG